MIDSHWRVSQSKGRMSWTFLESQGVPMSENPHPMMSVRQCGHCGNTNFVNVIASHSLVRTYDDHPRDQQTRDRGIIYELLSCPACEGVTLRSFGRRVDDSEIEFKILHPADHDRQVSLAEAIKQARMIDSAKVRSAMLGHLANIRDCNRSRHL